jgi:peptide chain release factor subunit 1
MLTAETIDRILRFDGQGLPVTSLYAPVQPGPGSSRDVHSRVTSLLDQITPMAKDSSLEHDVRLSVRGDIDRIREAAGEERWTPQAIAIFACSGRGLYEEVRLPRPVRDRIVADDTAYVRPMLAVLDEYHRICVAVVDKASARIWEIYQDEMREAGKVRDRHLRKPNYAAGDLEYRVRNKTDELSKRHYRNVAQRLDEMFRSGGFDLLIIGGHDYEVPAFTEFLSRDLRSRIAGTFSIDPSTEPVAEIRANADSILQRYEQNEKRQLAGEIYEKLATGGLAAAGLTSCLWAGSVAAIQTLLVLEGASVPGVVCRQSGWLALSGDIDPLSGSPTAPTPDVIEELAEAVVEEGGSVSHIADDDRLAGHTVAAALRFPLPPMPDAGS